MILFLVVNISLAVVRSEVLTELEILEIFPADGSASWNALPISFNETKSVKKRLIGWAWRRFDGELAAVMTSDGPRCRAKAFESREN
jgi:hypothetical protein